MVSYPLEVPPFGPENLLIATKASDTTVVVNVSFPTAGGLLAWCAGERSDFA
jgi:hypothetical protein